MTDKQFSTLFSGALADQDRDMYVSDWALSDIWGDPEGADIPDDRIQSLGALWDVAHITIREIRAATGLSQVAFAQRFCIPRRTVENWESGASVCPDYLRILLAQAVGLYTRG
jgi:DNA-binding XRE family transcriptional regulator